ncbi:MAG: FeoB-associated Cys-rich membrane protein [Leptospiraceae bacterium]|nr:FeoB-associated Cys-rich membrane protein [Leptospiraceae bacterium]MCB1304263.1 FeoB-associated Cys-rich membrane protein [Leptospiraceae bacterium]
MHIWEMAIVAFIISLAAGYLGSRIYSIFRSARKSSSCAGSCGCSVHESR